MRYARTVAAELADPLTPLLGTGAAATAVLGEATDAVLVGGAMVGSALISGFQRLRAETTLESLLLEQEVVAHREIRGGADDGGTEQVPAGALRVGDVICVESGDVVPADARLLECGDLEVDESGLTGESQAVAKDVAATPGAVLADRTCMLHEGTSVVAGRGRAVVVAVGAATAAGRATAAAGVAAPPAGVQARLGELTRSVLPLTLAGGGAVVGLSLLWRRPLKEAVKAGVAVAVAAVPEGLPLVATVAQQAAARRLSRRGAVVRSARVLEALGRVDTVCFDKTGTLTENRLRVVRLVPLGPGDRRGRLLALAAVAGDPADAHVHEVDRAVAAAARGTRTDPGDDPESCLPFTAGRGFSAGLRDGRLVVKGAPEVVLDRCADTGDARERVERLATEGLRVIAVADRRGRRRARRSGRGRGRTHAARAGRPRRRRAGLDDGGDRAAAGLGRAGARRDGRPSRDRLGDRRRGRDPGRGPGRHRGGVPPGVGRRADRDGAGDGGVRAAVAGAEGGAGRRAAQGGRDAGDDRRRGQRRRGDPARRRRRGRRAGRAGPSRPLRAARRTSCSPTPT